MNKRLVVDEFLKAAASYGEEVYRYQRSVEEVQWQNEPSDPSPLGERT